MSVSSIGAMAPKVSPYPSNPGVNGLKNPEDGSDKEMTTVTTHCKKEHRHNQSCPHSVSTRPAPNTGAPGGHLDQSV